MNKRVITAIGTPFLNNELKKYSEIEIMNQDIQYKEGIIEFLNANPYIDTIIISETLEGNIELEDLIDAIIDINDAISIILVFKNDIDHKIERFYLKIGVSQIYINNKVEIEEIAEYILESKNLKSVIIKEDKTKENQETKTVVKKKIKMLNIIFDIGIGIEIITIGGIIYGYFK